MIKITEQNNDNQQLPTLPFITRDNYGNLRLYFKNSNNVAFMLLHNKKENPNLTEYTEYNSIEQAINSFRACNEEVVDATLIIEK